MATEPTKSPIPISKLKDKNRGGFIYADQLAMDNALPQSNFPWIFDNEPNVTWNRRDIIPIKEIGETGDLEQFLEQPSRTGKNPEYTAIRGDIMENGYSLTELPPAVRQLEGEDGPVYIAIDGRTRLEILDSNAVPNAVVDIFTMDDPNFLRTGQIYNRYRKPYGEGSTSDIEYTIKELDKLDALGLDFKLNQITASNKANLKKRMKEASIAIENEANELSRHRLKPDQLGQIVSNVMNSFQSEKNALIRKFNNGGRIKEQLAKWGIFSTELIDVVPFSGSKQAVGMLHEAIFNRRDWLAANKHRQIYVVLYAGSINPKDQEGSWTNATVSGFKTRWDEFCEWSGKHSFHERVKIIGAIPQVRSLSVEVEGQACYPMDKLHYF